MIAASAMRELGRAVAEEAARGGVDAIGAAAEIDAVEIEFEDLVLGEAPFERQRQYALAQLAGEAAVVGQEDVAGELLGDRRDAAHPAAAGQAEPEAARDADRIDAGMRAEAPVLDRDHRVAHDRRDLARSAATRRSIGPIDWMIVAIGGADPDHLAEIVAADQLAIGRQLADRDRDRDAERDQADHQRDRAKSLRLVTTIRLKRERCGGAALAIGALGIELASHGGKQKRESP